MSEAETRTERLESLYQRKLATLAALKKITTAPGFQRGAVIFN